MKLVSTLGTLVGIISGGIPIAQKVEEWVAPDPSQVQVCQDLDASLARGELLPENGRTYSGLAADLALYASRVQDGSDLAQAIRATSEALDMFRASVSFLTHASSTTDDSFEMSPLNASSQLLAAIAATQYACEDLGVTFQNSRDYTTADGSITQSDAASFCSVTLALLKYMRSEGIDEHTMDLSKVSMNYALKGLPPDIFYARVILTVQLQEFMEGKPAREEADAAVVIISHYCKSIGAGDGWPDTLG